MISVEINTFKTCAARCHTISIVLAAIHTQGTMFGRYLAVERHTVDTVVVAIEGLSAEASPGIPDGDCLVRGGSAEAAAEGLPAHLIH